MSARPRPRTTCPSASTVSPCAPRGASNLREMRMRIGQKHRTEHQGLGYKMPPCDSEYPGYLRVLYLIQQGTQSSTPKTSQLGYLLTEVMKAGIAQTAALTTSFWVLGPICRRGRLPALERGQGYLCRMLAPKYARNHSEPVEGIENVRVSFPRDS